MIKGLKAELYDERTNTHETFKFDDGIVEYVNHLNEDKEKIHEPAYLIGSYGKIQIEAAIQYTKKTYSENILSFVNNIRTRDGGTHETGFKIAITKAFNDYARMKGILKEKDLNLDGMT